jgi:hypothetical protein
MKREKRKRKMVLVPEEEVSDNIGTILEALNDYILWWDQNSEGDKETRKAIKKAIVFAQRLEANVWGDA